MTVAIKCDVKADLREIIRRSPVRDVAGADDIMKECVFRSTEVWYGLLDDQVACMWGLIPPTLLSDSAYFWLLTTDIVAEHKFLFIRNSQRYIEAALKRWPTIIGDCVNPSVQTVRWLKWLGAEFFEPMGGKIPFVIRKRNG